MEKIEVGEYQYENPAEILQTDLERSPKISGAKTFLNTDFLLNMLILHKLLHESVNTQTPFITCFLKHVKVLKKKARRPCSMSKLAL